MNKSYLQKGFTLIELLVVIAIIGILSSVVLASLSTARSKGKATAVKSGLASLRTQMEVKADGGAYGPAANAGTAGLGEADCAGAGALSSAYYKADSSAASIVTNIVQNAGTGKTYCSVSNAASPTAFAVASVLPDASGSQCVDTTGNTKFYSGITTLTTTQVNNGACQ